MRPRSQIWSQIDHIKMLMRNIHLFSQPLNTSGFHERELVSFYLRGVIGFYLKLRADE